MPDTDYKKRSDKMEKLEEYFLQYAGDFDCEKLVQDYRGVNILNDEVYEEQISPIIDDYDEFNLQDSLASKLAWRDFKNDHSEKEIEEMLEKNGGYFGVQLYDYEKGYWEEFENHEYDRLCVKDEKTQQKRNSEPSA